MQLNLERPLIIFDLETTGISISSDRIVEMSYIKVYPDGREEAHTMRFNPERHIPEEATAVHHITDDDVKDCPTFREKAREIAQIFQDCDIAGFNSNRFDIPLLTEEMINAGVADFDLRQNSRFIDVQGIFHKMEQRTLVAAYKFYCQKDLGDLAHSASGDTRATYEVLQAQLDRYNNLQNDIQFLSDFSSQSKYIDFAGRFVKNDQGVPVFNFGKHKGRTVESVLRDPREQGYYQWMMQGDFSQDTKRALTRMYLQLLGK